MYRKEIHIMKSGKTIPVQRQFLFSRGKLHFSRSLERRVFFYLTLAMAVLGLMVRYGLLS
jgi:hypothetical protein